MNLKQALLSAVSALGLIGASVSIANSAVPPPTQGTLPGYHLGSVYVTGLSSGGFLANQLHVAYSGIFQGAGIFSAGPYDCANNSLITALYGCMATWAGHRTPAQLEQLTRTRASAGSIDPAGNLSGDPVWLYHGTSDSTVATSVNDDLATYYRDLGANVEYERTSAAGHAWVSPIGSNACAATSSPYVNDCGDDPVRRMLTHLLGSLNPVAPTGLTGKLIQFDQAPYVPGGNPAAVSMGEKGFAYVPRTCEDGATCRAVVALHGCYQYYGLVGSAFLGQSYLNEYADTNNLVILYPQATTMPGNPRGCWDWWGYQSAQYAVKSGPQMTAIVNMVRALGESRPR
jgi:poly(3-hydroxybutyrate) depolymerase